MDVRFLLCTRIPNVGLFNPEDVASLPEHIATQLIDAKRAVPADAPKAPLAREVKPPVVHERTMRDDLELTDESKEG